MRKMRPSGLMSDDGPKEDGNGGRVVNHGPMPGGFSSEVMLTAGTNLVLAALGLATGVLLARLLGPEARGEFAAIQMWPLFIVGLAPLGLPQALVYFCSRAPEQSRSCLASALAVYLVAAVPCVGVGYWLAPLVLAAQSAAVVSAAQWYVVFLPLAALVGFLLHPLQGSRQFVAWNLLRLAPGIAWLGLLITVLLANLASAGVLAAGHLATLALLLIPVGCIVAYRLTGSFRVQMSLSLAMLSYGLPTLATNLVETLRSRLDQLLMAAFLGPGNLGLYAVAVAWSTSTQPLVAAIAAVVFPRVASSRTLDKQVEAVMRGTHLAIVPSVLMTSVLIGVTPLAIPVLFGQEFVAAVPAALLLIVASTIGGINLVLASGIRGFGHPIAVLNAEVFGLAVSFGVLVLALPRLELLGAAIASLVGSATTACVLLGVASRLTGASAWELAMGSKLWKMLLSDLLRMTRAETRQPSRGIGGD